MTRSDRVLFFGPVFAWMRVGDFDRAAACLARGYDILTLLYGARQVQEWSR